ncbi:DUF3027 domain-containing protein [Antrihabitans sp. YC2-6]|nr:DUF3027 domain-containing protein [Antrihabitans sp. YC2-6]
MPRGIVVVTGVFATATRPAPGAILGLASVVHGSILSYLGGIGESGRVSLRAPPLSRGLLCSPLQPLHAVVRQNRGVSVAPSSELSELRDILAQAADLARAALVDLGEEGVGAYLGVTADDSCAATHRFEATLPGYRGWQWAVVVAADPESDHATVSESALLPGPDALLAPDWVPWDQRIRPGDLSPGDMLAPVADDPRLVPGYVATGDPEIDDVALELGLGRKQVLSPEGRGDAAQRWFENDFGPEAEMAKAAASTCGRCGFYLPLAGAMHDSFGVCANEMSADGHVVHTEYGCGAHSDTALPTGAGSPMYEAFDDGAIEVVLEAEPKAAAGSEPETDEGSAVEKGSASTD